MGPYDVTGTIKGTAVTLKYTVKFQDNDLPITMTGTLNGEAMGGKADFGGFAEGEWSAKKAGAAATATATSAPGAAAAAAGEWNLVFSTPNGDVPAKFLIKQDGENLTGDVKGEGPIGEVPLKGTLKGDVLEIKYTIKFEGNDLPITMKGKITGSEMKGSADYGGLAEGEFKGNKAGNAAAAAPAAALAAGEWNLVFSTPNGDVPAKFLIKQDGENLTGDVKGEGPIGEVPLKGTLKGDVLEIKYTIKFEGNDLPITMKGKITGNEMKGSADYGGLAEGEFKGKKN
jgi:hypothetical protein